MTESQEASQPASESGEPRLYALCGYTCQLCGNICAPADSFEWPLVPESSDLPFTETALICGDCFGRYFDVSEDFLDAAVKQAVERLKKRRQTSPPYNETRKQALERDGHTCQLCGEEGYPKTELGLGAFPVEAENYHLENLVTVCDDCFGQEPESLRTEAAQAKKWINAEKPEKDGNESN